MHDETGCFLLKSKTGGVYVIVSKSQGHHLIAGMKGNSCALLGQHKTPLSFVECKRPQIRWLAQNRLLGHDLCSCHSTKAHCSWK